MGPPQDMLWIENLVGTFMDTRPPYILSWIEYYLRSSRNKGAPGGIENPD